MKRLLVVITLLGTVLFSFGQEYRSPFNDLSITPADSGYSFIVSGHFYGDGGNKSGFPANTLLANLDWINSADATLLVCLGDLFKDVSNDIPNYQTALFDKLSIPLVNSVGNHDLTGSLYQDQFGETFFSFQIQSDWHIVLDTEIDNGDLSGDQLKLLENVRDQVTSGEVDNVFIYSHRTVWSDAYTELEGLFEDNTQSVGGTNYASEVLPILNEMGKQANVHWFSGSLGTAPASFFHFYDQTNNVRIMATAIRSLPRDAMLQVNVGMDGNVDFVTHSLTGEELLALERYDVAYWQEEVGAEPFNWKLVPYYIELMFTHRYFWYGVLATLFTFLSGYFFLKWRTKRRIKKMA